MFAEYVIDFVFNILAGLIGAALVLWVVDRRKRISLDADMIQPYADAARKNLLVSVKNRPLPRWLSWAYDGETASMCRAWIGFLNLDGSRFYENEMPGRWASTPEPKKPVFTPDGTVTWVPRTGDELIDWVDIPSGESEVLDVAVKLSDDSDCFGWNNDSYFASFRHPRFKLKPGRYIVQVRVKTGGRDYKWYFHLFNEGDFRLEKVGNKQLPIIHDFVYGDEVTIGPKIVLNEPFVSSNVDQIQSERLDDQEVEFRWTVDYDSEPQALVLNFLNLTSDSIFVEYAELISHTGQFDLARDGVIARNEIMLPKEPWVLQVPLVSKFEPGAFQKKVIYPSIGVRASVRVYGQYQGQKCDMHFLIQPYNEI